jgi:hypothetical protein
MSRSKKTKPNPSTSPEDLSIYLRESSLIPRFNKFRALDIFPGRFVQFDDFGEFQLEHLFQRVGLLDLCSVDTIVPYYPNLICLFYTNTTVEALLVGGDKVLSSLVKGIEVKLTPAIIGDILDIPCTGIQLHEVRMDNAALLKDHIYLPGKSSPMQNNKLRPIPRLVCRILAYNVLPKTGSFDHISGELAAATYAVMAGLKVNWSMVLFENMQRVPSSYLPYGCTLSKIFRFYKVDVDSEKVKVDYHEFIDRATYARMKLGGIQGSDSQGEDPTSSSALPVPSSSRPTLSSIHETLEDLSTRVDGLAVGQVKVLKNQKDLFKAFEDVNKKVDTLTDMVRGHFFPPPPPSST